jgi:Protein of unknown function (DUF4058)
MSSPFPGMDPFIENQEWEDFHTRLHTALSDNLSPRLEPAYVIRVERRVYVEFPSHGSETGQWRRVDAAIVVAESPPFERPDEAAPSAGGASVAVCELPIPEERRETYLVIREQETREIVTVIETLSPSNKRSGDGRREYLEKREAVLRSQAHLVELDLLRGGYRLPMVTPLPPGDYYAIISRRPRRPHAEVYSWTIRQPLPVIPIPLRGDDPDVHVELQPLFESLYDRARYDLTIDYSSPVDPPFSEEEQAWVSTILSERQSTARPDAK